MEETEEETDIPEREEAHKRRDRTERSGKTWFESQRHAMASSYSPSRARPRGS